jgi:ABC-type transport system involved in multi-copper enzyme maturation permease subunit
MTEPSKEWVGFSPQRVWTIALNTLTESVRQKVYLIMILFALVLIANASFFSQFSFGEDSGSEAMEKLKFIKDFSLGAISIFGMLIAIVGTAQLIPNEMENRTIYTILAKPVRRLEFLLGKYLGSALLVLVSLAMMSVMFGAALKFKGDSYLREARATAGQAQDAGSAEEAARQTQRIHAAVYDANIVKALALAYLKLALLAAITLLVSTFSTSMVFNVAVALMVFFAGHLVGPAKEKWGQSGAAQFLLALIPDLSLFNVTDDVAIGHAGIPWAYVLKVAAYGGMYLMAVLGAAHFIFADREM